MPRSITRWGSVGGGLFAAAMLAVVSRYGSEPQRVELEPVGDSTSTSLKVPRSAPLASPLPSLRPPLSSPPPPPPRSGPSLPPSSPPSRPPTSPPSVPPGATYYLDSVAGSDTSAATSQSAPWRTLERATSHTFQPGDRLMLRRGRTWSGSLEVAESGTAAAPISIGAYGAGSAPILTGASTCVQVGGSHVLIGQLQIDNCTWAGISIGGSANSVTGNLLTHNAVGVRVEPGAADNKILSNDIVDNRRMSVLTVGGQDDSGAFGVALEGDSTEVAYNTISGHHAFSHDFGQDGAAIEVYGGRNNQIRHNLAVDNNSFAELGKSGSAQNVFAYNVVRSSLPNASFLITRGASSDFGPVMGTRMLNNTAVLTGRGSVGFVCHAGCSPEILIMRNNIVQAVSKSGYADAPFDGDYNLYWGGQQQFSPGSHDIVANPRFVGGSNLHLAADSPAVDSGVASGYATDFDRKPLVGAPDRGAYERR